MASPLIHCLPGTLLVLTFGLDLAAQEIRSTNGGGNWSAASTWLRIGSGPATPQAGDLVIVTPGNPVVLDASTPSLRRLEIHDLFTILDTQARNIVASRIDVGGSSSVPAFDHIQGSFIAGSAATPFQNQLTIQLTDFYLSPTYTSLNNVTENFQFVVHDTSTLQLHGKNTGAGGAARVSWSRVAASVPSGSTSMTLAMSGAPGWSSQDQIVIASTDYDMMQREILSVASSTVGGAVTFGPMTGHYHHGAIELGLVDERAEVGLLTHNIRVFSVPVQSPVGSQGRQDIRAGSLTIRKTFDATPTVRLDYVEFYNLGWKGAAGRYPIHIHALGDVTANDFWVRNCSIHHCFNRAIAIHGTHGVTIDRNVMCDTLGHSFYLEDRSERDNIIANNLVLVTRVPTLPLDLNVQHLGAPWATSNGEHYFCEHDTQVASYWITNTSNDVIDNVAAGSDWHGFWYDVSSNGNDPPFSAIHNPCKVGFGEFAQHPVGLPGSRFSGNVAHSNGKHGFYNDDTYWMPADLSLATPLQTWNLFENFTAYKNRDAGIWNRGHGTHIWRNARLADNRLGVYFGSAGNTKDGITNGPLDPLNMPSLNKFFDDLIVGAPCYSFQLLDDSFVIGVSTNSPSDPQSNTWAELVGVALYDGVIYIRDTQFRNFLNSPRSPQPVTGLTTRVATAITTHTSPSTFLGAQIAYAIDPRSAVENCDFLNCSNEVLYPNPIEPLQAAIYSASATQIFPIFWFGIDGPSSGTSSQPATYFGNAVDNVVLLDVDGCLSGSFAGAYHVHESPLMRPAGSSSQAARQVATGWLTQGAPDFYRGWARPLMFGGPGTSDNQAVAQFRLKIPRTPLAQASGVYRIAVTTSGTRTESRNIYDQNWSGLFPVSSPTHAEEKLFQANILLTKPGLAEETYQLVYPVTATPPANFQVLLQFGPSDPASSPPVRTAVFQIPYRNTPPTRMLVTHHLFSTGVDIMGIVAPSLAAFQAGQGMWFHDAATSSLWLRMWCTDLTGFGLGLTPLHPVFSGREMTITVG